MQPKDTVTTAQWIAALGLCGRHSPMRKLDVFRTVSEVWLSVSRPKAWLLHTAVEEMGAVTS